MQSEFSIGDFFARFARQSNADDIAALVSQFADPFLSASPQGTQSVRATELAATLKKKKELFNRLGSMPSELIDLHETPLDSRYVLARATWRMSFVRDGGTIQEVLVDSTYLVDTAGNDCKIVLYLTHQDLMQILRGRGIIGSQLTN